MIVSKRPDVERLLKGPPDTVRAVLLYGKDRGGVRERADGLARRVTPDLNDPFNVAMLTETDLDQPGKLEEELTALSMMGGRRLIRVRLTGERAAPDKTAAEALTAHAEGRLNPDAFLIIEAGALGRDSALRKAAEKATAAAAIPCYEDEQGDVARMTREALAADKVGLTADALERFVARLPRERFLGLMRSEPDFAMAMAQMITKRARAMSAQLYEMATLKLGDRLRLELRRLALLQGFVSGEALIYPAPTHQALAARLATTRESVSRELSRLAHAGVIVCGRQRIIIKDLARLTAG